MPSGSKAFGQTFQHVLGLHNMRFGAHLRGIKAPASIPVLVFACDSAAMRYLCRIMSCRCKTVLLAVVKMKVGTRSCGEVVDLGIR